MDGSQEDLRILAPRFKYLYGAVVFAVFIVFTRLWFLQIISGSELREFSEQNLLKEVKIPAPRGILYDRNGQILVENLPGFDVTISPQYVTDLDKTAEAVGQILKIPGPELVQKVKVSRKRDGPFRPVVIKSFLSRDEVFGLELLKLDHPGLDIKENILRTYVLGPNGAHVFGYVGEISKEQLPKFNKKFNGAISFKQGDIIGKSGLEEVFDLYLRGKDGLSFIKVDAKGREASSDEIEFLGSLNKIEKAMPGSNVVLTLDKDIQEAAHKSFFDQDRTGALFAMKTNGEVLAWISAPEFDPNVFSSGVTAQMWSKLINHPDKPLRNKVIQDYRAPGSTFKPIVAVAALQEKEITKDTLVSAPSQLRFGNRVYHDHTKTGQGVIKVREAIERSSNVFFYKMGIALGVDRIAKYAKGLGLGEKSGIELNNEMPGLIPTSQWKQEARGEAWQPGENLSVAIGQGFVNVTPIQMAIAYNSIATEGKVVKPFLVKRILSNDGNVVLENQPTVKRDLSLASSEAYISPETFKAVKEGMWAVGNGYSGTARLYKVPGVEIAGKTGTAQTRSFAADQIYVRCESRPREQRHHGWFIGYAPAENPEIIIAVLAEHSCHGSTGAAPVVRDVISAYMEKNYPERMRAARELAKEKQKRFLPPTEPIVQEGE